MGTTHLKPTGIMKVVTTNQDKIQSDKKMLKKKNAKTSINHVIHKLRRSDFLSDITKKMHIYIFVVKLVMTKPVQKRVKETLKIAAIIHSWQN